jgi:hypothetical protein
VGDVLPTSVNYVHFATHTPSHTHARTPTHPNDAISRVCASGWLVQGIEERRAVPVYGVQPSADTIAAEDLRRVLVPHDPFDGTAHCQRPRILSVPRRKHTQVPTAGSSLQATTPVICYLGGLPKLDVTERSVEQKR